MISCTDVADSTVQDYWALTKPKVMSLVLFTGFVGLLLAPQSIGPFASFLGLLWLATGAGGSAALNMWYERDLDRKMARTRTRPLPMGLIQPGDALAFGMILSTGSVLMMALTVNWLSAALLAFTIVFYAYFYTILLKPNTPQNIVIGGLSGAMPPLIGWTIATNSVSIQPLMLVLIIFLWTPPHFWALSILKMDDYRRAKLPMLPLVVGVPRTLIQIFLYGLMLFGASLLPLFLHMFGLFYGVCAGILGGIFLFKSYQLLQNPSGALSLFLYSIAYLFLLFSAMIIDHFLRVF